MQLYILNLENARDIGESTDFNKINKKMKERIK